MLHRSTLYLTNQLRQCHTLLLLLPLAPPRKTPQLAAECRFA
jgi:hypothetical protein